MNQLISKNLSAVQKACKKFSVSNLYLFGSATNTDFDSNSDIDFAVQFSEEISPLERGEAYFDLFYFLEDLFKRKIDLVSYNVIKNPIFKKEVDKTKVELYAE